MTIQQAVHARIPTEAGEFKLYLYRNEYDDKEHLALVMGNVAQHDHPLVRVHSECFTGDVLGSLRCDCGPQLAQAMQLIANEGVGLIIYLRQEGRGIGLLDKLRAYNLQDEGYDTVEANLMLGHRADARDYTMAALILRDLNVNSLRLLTNNPTKVEGLQELGLQVSAREPLVTAVHDENLSYLQTKVKRMRHLLTLDQVTSSEARQVEVKSVKMRHSLENEHHSINSGDKHLLNGAMKKRKSLDYLTNGTLPQLSSHLKQALQPETVSDTLPFVTLTYAQSLDGSIARRRGEPMALSGPQSLLMTHYLRANHDAILVGIGTVLADNPRLNVRLVTGKAPLPIILDSQLNFPLDARLLVCHQSVWIATTEQAPLSRQLALEALGVKILRLPANKRGQVCLHALLPMLRELGIQHLMVEGGANVITNFLATRLVNRLVLTIAPLLIGGLRGVCQLDQTDSRSLPRLHNPPYEKLGDDLLLFGDVEWEQSP